MKKLAEKIREELKLLAVQKDDDIDFSDIPATSESDWDDAIRGKYFRPVKQQHPIKRVNVPLSLEVVEYFKSSGDGWQTRIDAALRQFITEHANQGPAVTIDA